MSENSTSLLHRLMIPSSALMSRLNLRTKLICLFVLLSLPMFVVATNTFLQQQETLDIVRKEIQGVDIAHQLIKILVNAQRHRGQVNLKLSGQNNDADLAQTRSEMGLATDNLDALIARSPDLNINQEWRPITDELHQLKNGSIAATATESFAQHTRLIDKLLRFSTFSNEQSGLLLDPEAASYFLMDVSAEKLPVWIEHLAILRGLAACRT